MTPVPFTSVGLPTQKLQIPCRWFTYICLSSHSKLIYKCENVWFDPTFCKTYILYLTYNVFMIHVIMKLPSTEMGTPSSLVTYISSLFAFLQHIYSIHSPGSINWINTYNLILNNRKTMWHSNDHTEKMWIYSLGPLHHSEEPSINSSVWSYMVILLSVADVKSSCIN